MTVRHERENIYRVEVQGLLRSSEFEQCQDVLRVEMRPRRPTSGCCSSSTRSRAGSRSDDWRDLSFYVSHGDAIERIAIVGDERWRSESLMFASADLRKGARGFLFAGAAHRRARLAVGLNGHQKDE